MKNTSPIFGLLFTAVLLIYASACSQSKNLQMENQAETPEPLSIAKGNYAPFQPGDDEAVFELLIQSQDAYESLAREFEKGGFSDPFPEIDFSKRMVAAVWLGESNSSGYNIEITGFDEQEDRFQIWVRNEFPDPSCAYLTVITTPFHIVSLPRSDKPVTFRFNRVMNSCN